MICLLVAMHDDIGNYGRICQMTYQPKRVNKMADFETLTLRISLISIQICTYFCNDSVTTYCLYLVKKFDSQLSSVFKVILLPTPCSHGLDEMWNSCTRELAVDDAE